MSDEAKETDPYRLAVARARCEADHLFFTRYFFKARHDIKFLVNWHHRLISDTVDDIISGKLKNVVINVPPGSSKTEMVVINLMARGLAINPRARFLHLSGSDTLASLNSSSAREIIRSDKYQALWPLKIADDAKAKKRWNIEVDGQVAGGVYATSLGGQITGFRAGHMAPGFQGCIIVDDPLKPEDAFSDTKLDAANRKLLTTVKSRKANPETPIIIIMQRLAENDPSGFIEKGNLGPGWQFIRIPAVMDHKELQKLPEKYRKDVDSSQVAKDGRFSYWPYKEPVEQLLAMEKGEGSDQNGSRVSRHVFNSQYQQSPVAIGGNIIRGEYFVRYKILPKIKYRKIFADTAQKTKEANDFSVFECWGMGDDGKIYLLDLIRGKWEAPELKKRAIAFWNKHKNANVYEVEKYGQLREMIVEDKSSGTGLIQEIRLLNSIPIKGMERVKDKLTRIMDVLPYLEAKFVCVGEDDSYTNDFIAECESFTADDSHDYDDQVDPMIDAIVDMLSTGNKLKQWEQLAAKGG